LIISKEENSLFGGGAPATISVRVTFTADATGTRTL
jgi:hypothetical protein